MPARRMKTFTAGSASCSESSAGKRCGDYRGGDSGKKSPVLVTEEMVKAMALGSVIVDLAAERGGNCEITEAGKTVVKHGVTIIGAINLAARRALSREYDVRPQHHCLFDSPDQRSKLNLNLEDEIVRETLLTRGGEIVQHGSASFLSLPALVTALVQGHGFGCPPSQSTRLLSSKAVRSCRATRFHGGKMNSSST
jgi:hypothetical protein